MKEVEIELSGQLVLSEKRYFGGRFSFFESLRIGGTGSPKIVYDKGITAFDEMDDGIANEMSFVSFELLKNGLIIRLNRTQKLCCVGAKLNEIEKIKLTRFKVDDTAEGSGYRGLLEIQEYNGSNSSFSIFTQNFNSLLQFLKKQPLVAKLEYIKQEYYV